MLHAVADLQAARRYITGVLLNVDVDTREMSVATLLVMLDHFIEHPEEYEEIVNARL